MWNKVLACMVGRRSTRESELRNFIIFLHSFLCCSKKSSAFLIAWSIFQYLQYVDLIYKDSNILLR